MQETYHRFHLLTIMQLQPGNPGLLPQAGPLWQMLNGIAIFRAAPYTPDFCVSIGQLRSFVREFSTSTVCSTVYMLIILCSIAL